MKPIDQKELVTNLKNGHEASFTLLYNIYGQKIYNLAYRMVGNKQDAEDITQQTLLQVYRNIESFNEKSQLYTWIYTITKNLCYRFFQRQKKNASANLEALIHTAQAEEIPPEMTALERQYLINQIKDGCLTGLLRCLSFYQRVAFILHVLLHLPIREVAEILDKSEGATKVLIHRARQNLKQFLCKNCSLYDPNNPCHCEHLLGFSLKQGWITRPSPPSPGELAEFIPIDPGITDPRIIEAEIKHIKKITELYTALPEPSPSENLGHRLQKLINSQDWMIFSQKKV